MVPQVAFFFSLCWRKCRQTNGHETSRRWVVFFAKRTCVSSAVVADQTAVLTDDSNVEEVATSEALSESDGSGAESQSGESESDACSTACQNEEEAILDLEAEPYGAAVSDTITQSIWVDAVRAALSGRSQSLSDTEKRFVIENKKSSEQTVLLSREYPESRRKSGTSTRSLLLKWFDRYDWPHCTRCWISLVRSA